MKALRDTIGSLVGVAGLVLLYYGLRIMGVSSEEAKAGIDRMFRLVTKQERAQ